MAELNLGSGTGSPSPRRRAILPMLMGVLMWPLFFFVFSGAPACMGFEGPTIAAIEACPAAASALGTPVQRSWIGWSCGNAETSDAFGQASWTFPVSGPNGSGSISVVAEKRGGPWQLYQAMLSVNGQTIDVLACTGGAAAGPVPSLAFEASVAEVIGHPSVQQGWVCQMNVGPGGGPFPCRVHITCGGADLYGSGSTGYCQCTRDGSGQVTARDPRATPEDNDPTLDLRMADGEALLTDQASGGTWVVRLRFAPGGQGPPPAVPTPPIPPG